MMITTGVFAPDLDHGSAAKLTPPNHQRIFQESALLQVFQERGRRLIRVFAGIPYP